MILCFLNNLYRFDEEGLHVCQSMDSGFLSLSVVFGNKLFRQLVDLGFKAFP